MQRVHSQWSLALLVALLATGCATLRAPNDPIDRIDLESGYRPERILGARTLDDLALVVTFSGGGTRAAALAYGVLEELRDTRVTIGGQPKRLLDEIDVISSVSGGSFTAAYYGLFGDRIFEDFDERFLKRNVQRDLLLRMLWPQNFFRLIFSFFDRTALAVGYYDEKIFDGARFSDLTKAGGPLIQINATDLSTGSQFTFVQPQFDLLCSDLSSLKVALAVTASSAVPVVFPSILLRNHAGSCDFERPAWLAEALASRREEPRRYDAASEMAAYLDPQATPYIHLVDGGIADNLGLRAMLERLDAMGDELFVRLSQQPPRNILIILVNAETNPDRVIEKTANKPSIGATVSAMSNAQISRYNLETRDDLRRKVKEFEALAEQHNLPTRFYYAEVEFDDAPTTEVSRFLNNLPTSLELDDEDIDKLIASARMLLRHEPAFERFLQRNDGRRSADAISDDEICRYLSHERCR